MKLPYKFQFRHNKFPGHTHSVSLNAHGDYEVKWARGWATVIDQVPWVIASQEEVEGLVKVGDWIIVEDKPKQENSMNSLPDEFYFKVYGQGCVYKMKRDGDGYHCTDPHAPADEGGHHTYAFTKRTIEEGSWVVCNAPLTAEQKKQLKDFKEQIAQLEQSIKLNQQDICHKERLVANYEQRKSDVLSKIAELEVK